MSRRQSKQAWVTGTTCAIPMRISRFETMAKNLGLREDQWKSSAELKQFAMQNKDTYYVPTVCLNAWGLTTIYDEGTKPSTLVPDTDISLQDISELDEPVYSPEYL